MNGRPERLDPPVDRERDHVLGGDAAEVTLVEYGSYVCSYCHTAHGVVRELRDRFGGRMRYAFRHLPLADRAEAARAAELAEYAAAMTGDFWAVHDVLMRRGPMFHEGELDEIGARFGVPSREERDAELLRAAGQRVREDARSGIRSGARVTPTFFINGRRYEGPWDEAALSEAMLRSLGHRIHAASVDFARWAPSTGVLLLIMTVLAVALSNTALGPAFLQFWNTPLGLRAGNGGFDLPLIDWVNHGLLTIFFLVVGLEIKRELTVGRLSSRRAAALPIAAAAGGMITPALIYLFIVPAEFHHGWGVTIATDTAFAVALIVLLGPRVPVDLRVFLTAAVIADDLVAIVVVALVYSESIHLVWLGVAGASTVVLFLLNRWRFYRALPYAVLGIVLWFALHEAGIHATLAGVLLAVATPTRPPPNMTALLAQAQAVIDAETRRRGEEVMRTGPSEPALRQLDAVHDRLESPASKLLRTVEPWSSYFVLPVFALANAGVVWAADVFAGHGRLMLGIVLGLVVGKFAGITAGARLAVRTGIAAKPPSYSWRQLAGAGALAGIGFTMSLFIASQAFDSTTFAAAKIAIFIASIVAAIIGAIILWRTPVGAGELTGAEEDDTQELGSPVGETEYAAA
jgi:NhaA family Na+:H+ antiporter